ncbi:MAG: BatD family protein, partial [Candidatus Babeliales bacterium]
LFNSGMEQKQIFSQAVSLDVQELPEHTGPVHGIGVYDSLTAVVDHAQAQEGEGIVYRLTLKGDGDLQSIQPLELTMQEGLKYYESKNFIDAAKKEKTFEYIVQGIKAGSWEIPPARFTYYDLQKRAYVTLESNPIIITINESAHQKDLYAEKQNKEGQKKDEESHVMLNEGPWYAHKERSLSWWLFWLLFFIPLVGIAYSLINRFIENYYTQHSAMFRKKKAFSHARAALKAAELSNNQQNLYTIFVQCFVDRCALVPSAVTVESIDSYLHQAGMPVEVRKQWQEFFDTIVQIKFFQGFKADIFKEAYTWLNQLENYI